MAKTRRGEEPSFTPLYDRVIVKEDEAPDHKGAIIIPDIAKEKMQRGVVIAAGEGRVSDLTNEIRPMRVKPGDRVIYGKFTGDPIEIDNIKYLLMREDQIYGVINK